MHTFGEFFQPDREKSLPSRWVYPWGQLGHASMCRPTLAKTTIPWEFVPPFHMKVWKFLPREWKLVVGRSLGRSCRSRRGCWLSYYFSFQKSTLIWAEKNWFATSYWFGAKIVTFYIQTFREVFISQDGILGPRISGVCANIILSRSSLCWFPEEKTREWLDNFLVNPKLMQQQQQQQIREGVKCNDIHFSCAPGTLYSISLGSS